jgi:hypothetical protein
MKVETTSETWAEPTVKSTTTSKLRWREPAAYLVALVLCLWILERLIKLRRADLHVPLIYDGGDAMYYMMVIKAIITNGWYLNNPYLGAPYGLAMHDFPMPDNISYLMIKVLGFFTSSFGLVMNLFCLLQFALHLHLLSSESQRGAFDVRGLLRGAVNGDGHLVDLHRRVVVVARRAGPLELAQ